MFTFYTKRPETKTNYAIIDREVSIKVGEKKILIVEDGIDDIRGGFVEQLKGDTTIFRLLIRPPMVEIEAPKAQWERTYPKCTVRVFLVVHITNHNNIDIKIKGRGGDIECPQLDLL